MIKAIFGNIHHQINGGYTLLTTTTKLVDLANCFKSPKSPKLNMLQIMHKQKVYSLIHQIIIKQ